MNLCGRLSRAVRFTSHRGRTGLETRPHRISLVAASAAILSDSALQRITYDRRVAEGRRGSAVIGAFRVYAKSSCARIKRV